ncbi:MAG: ferritin-like domain-containing protein [Methanoculleaceae archaeon]
MGVTSDPAHEKKVTGFVNALMGEAIGGRDDATVSLIHRFVNEQVEGEKNARDILDRLRVASAESGTCRACFHSTC